MIDILLARPNTFQSLELMLCIVLKYYIHSIICQGIINYERCAKKFRFLWGELLEQKVRSLCPGGF